MDDTVFSVERIQQALAALGVDSEQGAPDSVARATGRLLALAEFVAMVDVRDRLMQEDLAQGFRDMAGLLASQTGHTDSALRMAFAESGARRMVLGLDGAAAEGLRTLLNSLITELHSAREQL
ncbi:hypothetical protein ACFXAZ_38935 [Streptomyces sp. NPDC059477]|uniref:hypothetical protein n=1 Tax=Streptomyces sp. NPDC059477 TaxID=3346847 RepID=UPI0036A6E1A0